MDDEEEEHSLPLVGLLPPGPAVLSVMGRMAPVVVVVRAATGMAAPVAGPAATAARRAPSRPLDRRDRRHPRRRRRSTRQCFQPRRSRAVDFLGLLVLTQANMLSKLMRLFPVFLFTKMPK